jgi:hypothetical protein
LLKITPQTILNQLESKGYDFPRPLAPEVEVVQERKRSRLIWFAPISLLLLFIFFSSSKPIEQKRVITQPYHGYQSELKELS